MRNRTPLGDGGEEIVLELEPGVKADMRALGYMNPEWGHGVWHGELELGREDWNFDDVSPQDPDPSACSSHCAEPEWVTKWASESRADHFRHIRQFGFNDI